MLLCVRFRTDAIKSTAQSFHNHGQKKKQAEQAIERVCQEHQSFRKQTDDESS